MSLRTFTCIAATLLSLAASAQNVWSTVLDTSIIGGDPWRMSVLCSDGSSVLWLGNEDGTLLRRMDMSGNMVWNKWYAGARGPYSHEDDALKPDDNGGFYMAHLPEGSMYGTNSNDPDTAVGRVVVTRIASDGSVVWRSDLERTLIGNYPFISQVYPTSVSLAVHDQGSMYVLVETYLPPSSAQWQLIALDPSIGTILWTRDIGDIGGFGVSSGHAFLTAVCTNNGDVIVGNETGGAMGELFLSRISTAGDLLWMNRYRYTNGPIYGRFDDFIVSPTGKIIAMGAVQMLGQNGCLLFHIEDDGTLDKGELVQENITFSGGELDLAPDGRLIVQLDLTSNPGGWSTGILFGDTVGGNMVRHVLDTPVVGPNTVTNTLYGLHVSGQQMLMSGYVLETDNQFGNWTRRPAIAQFDALAFSHCLDSAGVVTRLLIPPGLVVTAPCVDGASAPSAYPYIQVASTPVPLVDVPSVAMIDLCAMVISTDEIVRPDVALSVWPTPAAAGAILHISGTERCTIQLLDAQGRVVSVRSPSMATEVSIATQALVPGAYSVRCTSTDGVVRVARVVVE